MAQDIQFINWITNQPTNINPPGAINLPTSVNSISGSDVLLNNASNYFDGPSCAQGTSGTWFASGTVTLVDTAASATFKLKLWDGTTVISSAQTTSSAANLQTTVSLSGILTTPAANIRISAKSSLTTSKILFNASGNSADSTLTAVRIG